MKRHLFNILTAFSLSVFALSVAIDLRSYFVAGAVGWVVWDTDVEDRGFLVGWVRGCFEIDWFSAYVNQRPPALPSQWFYTRCDPQYARFGTPRTTDTHQLHLGPFQLRYGASHF